MPTRTIIQSVAHFVPEKIVTNNDLSKLMDTSDEWITERTGIKERRFVDGVTPCSELALQASIKAIDKAGIKAEDIDLIIASTLSPDLYFPGIGTIIQNKLGDKKIPALDIRAQCSGFVYGLSTADAFIKSKQAKTVLLVCSEVQSPVLDMSNEGRQMAVLFGDGAGALVLKADETESDNLISSKESGIITSHLGSDGSGAEVLCLKSPGTSTENFIQIKDIEQKLTHPFMDGRQVFKNAVTRMIESVKIIIEKSGISPDDINLVVPHQANLRINEAIREKLKLPKEKVFNNIQKYGNTTSATIPICLSEAEAEGRLKKGDLVLTVAFGAGFTWGANLLRW